MYFSCTGCTELTASWKQMETQGFCNAVRGKTAPVTAAETRRPWADPWGCVELCKDLLGIAKKHRRFSMSCVSLITTDCTVFIRRRKCKAQVLADWRWLNEKQSELVWAVRSTDRLGERLRQWIVLDYVGYTVELRYHCDKPFILQIQAL